MMPALVLLEISKLSPPVPEGDVPLLTVLAFAALNPAVIAVSFLMGRRADQPAKVIIAAFAGAVAGVALVWLAAELRIGLAPSAGRAAAGIFVLSLLFGLGWASLGYRLRHSG